MKSLWSKAGVLGSVSVAFGSMLWSQKKTSPDQVASSSSPGDSNPDSPYELKLVQVLFRHGARTPLKSIPDVMEVTPPPPLCLLKEAVPLNINTTQHNKQLHDPLFVSSKVQWVPTLLEPPAHTHINYVVTDLQGGPRPSAPVEDSYRRSILTVSRCVLYC